MIFNVEKYSHLKYHLSNRDEAPFLRKLMKAVFKPNRIIQRRGRRGIQQKSSLQFKKTVKKCYTISYEGDLEGR